MTNFAADESLKELAHRLLAPFQFTAAQKREVWEALKASPDGVERCALQAKAYAQRDGTSGAGLLLTMIRRNDHLIEADPDVLRPTGWRYVRGTHSGTFVPDPSGTDPLPAGYDFMTHSPQHDQEVEEVEHTPEQRQEIGRLLRGWVLERFGMDKATRPEHVTVELEELPAGICDDCKRDGNDAEVRIRWRYGKLTLCGSCVTSRRKAASKVLGR
jgi:hypothetical protein